MARISHKARKRLAILFLLVGLPVYIIVAMNVVVLFDRPNVLVELLIYVVLGVVWALPLRALFRGIGREDPGGGNGRGEG